MIFTIKGEIVKQQDFVQVGWCLAYDGRPSMYKVYHLDSKKKALNYVAKQNELMPIVDQAYHLMEIYVKKEDENE